jgi:hypothetical protein
MYSTHLRLASFRLVPSIVALVQRVDVMRCGRLRHFDAFWQPDRNTFSGQSTGQPDVINGPKHARDFVCGVVEKLWPNYSASQSLQDVDITASPPAQHRHPGWPTERYSWFKTHAGSSLPNDTCFNGLREHRTRFLQNRGDIHNGTQRQRGCGIQRLHL